VLLGRDEEQRRILRLLADARLGRSGALAICGEAGAGKTALVDHALQQSDGMFVLSVSGVETEADIPFASLHALLRPLLDLIDAIPPTQASALRTALALEDADPDRLRACAGTLSLLAAAAERQPVLVAVDDAQWLDRASADALLFTGRRIAGEGVAMLFAARTGDGADFAVPGIERLELAPLDERSSLLLLRERWGSELAAPVARRIVGAVGGNPLGLLEVSSLLSDRERTGLESLREPLPVTTSVEHGVRRQLRGLPTETRRALLLAAAADSPPDLLVDELEPAEEAGLVRLRDGNVAFRHPLVRAAVYNSASKQAQRRAHVELAETYERAGEHDLRAWHLAAASEQPDEAVAAALEAAAQRARERGGHASQARALGRAAELSAEDDSRARRLTAAAGAAYLAGDPDRAMEFVEGAAAVAREPVLRADVLHRQAVIADWYGTWQERVVPDEVLEREAVQMERVDPLRAVGLLGVILQRRFQALHTNAALALAERRLALSEPLGGERHLRAVQDLARAAGLRGEAERCSALCDTVLAECPAEGAPAFATNISEPLLWLERYEECRWLLRASVESARAEGNVVRLMFELTNLALLELRTGRYTPALGAASEALDLAEVSGNDYLVACNLAVLARVEAVRGEPGYREHAEGALSRAARLADELIASEATIALAEGALVEGRPEQVVELLQPLRRLAVENEVGEPSVLPFGPLLVEAYARAGKEDDAEAELERINADAAAVGRRWALAAIARCRGFLAPAGEIDDHFRTALALHAEGAGTGFDSARTSLVYGERLRRARRRVDAREQIRGAIATFDELGASPWSERARVELEASGASIPRRDPTAPEKLTPQELQIALQVAEGKTNREIAVALFLSPKTIEFHLTRVYRKLELHSRAELIRLLAREVSARDTVDVTR
jgi:DNA-binding CsgD family transcriptional regulator